MENITEIFSTYVGSRGFVVILDTGFDFTGIGKVVFIIEKPDCSTVLREVLVADYGQGTNLDEVNGTVLDTDLDQEGDYFYSVSVVSADESLLLFSDKLKQTVEKASVTAAQILAV